MQRDYFADDAQETEEEVKRPGLMNLEGRRSGQWTMIKKLPGSKYLCKCDCGVTASKRIYEVLRNQGNGCAVCSKKVVRKMISELYAPSEGRTLWGNQ